MEETFIGGYWSARAESIDESASKMTMFLKELETYGELFSNLKLPAFSKKQAMLNLLEINKSTLEFELRKGRKRNEIGDEGFCGIGFLLLLFDEIHEELSVEVNFSIGAYFDGINNCCFVKVNGQKLNKNIQNNILNLIKKVFNPETIRNE